MKSRVATGSSSKRIPDDQVRCRGGIRRSPGDPWSRYDLHAGGLLAPFSVVAARLENLYSLLPVRLSAPSGSALSESRVFRATRKATPSADGSAKSTVGNGRLISFPFHIACYD